MLGMTPDCAASQAYSDSRKGSPANRGRFGDHRAMPATQAERRELRRRCSLVGWSATELYVGDSLLAHGNDRVVPLFARLCERLAAARERR
jgi:hypothetical protein